MRFNLWFTSPAPEGQQGVLHVDRTIARLNVEHFRKLLTYEIEGERRQTILCLLAEEEAKLALLDSQPRERKLKQSI